MKRFISLSIVFMLIMTLLLTISNAESNNQQYTDKEINTILDKAGVPKSLMDELDVSTKRFIVENSGDNLEYVGSKAQYFVRNPETGILEEVETDPSDISPMAIPSADLKLTPIHFNISINGIQMVEIFSSFEWLRNPKTGPDGINQDHIAIAVPEGWEIQAGRYGCGYQKYDYSINQGWHWSTVSSFGCGDNGTPTEFGGLYGAAWEFVRQGSGDVGIPFIKYKGTVKLTMKKVDPNAIHRIVTSYNEASSNFFGNYSVTLAWGAASVTFTPQQGSSDQREVDYTW